MARDERRPVEKGTPKELKRGLEKYAYATQGNFDHLSGQAREFARQFNLLASDVATLYDFFGLDQFDEAVEIGGGGGISSLVDHHELDGLSLDDHPQYPLHASTETISGAWTWSADVTYNNATAIKFKDSGGTARNVVHATAGNIIQIGNTGFGGGISFFGSNMNFAPDGTTRALIDSNGQLTLDLADSGATRGLAFGSAEDTNLYRHAADSLRTDDNFYVDGVLFGDTSGNTFWNNNGNPNARTITKGTGHVGLAIRGQAGQTADLQNWQLNTGTPKAWVDGDSDAMFGTAGAATDKAFFTAANQTDFAQFLLNINGKMNWGPGGATPQDTNLYRAQANVLATDDIFSISAVASATSWFDIQKSDGTHRAYVSWVTADTNYRLDIDGNGKLLWGPGNAAGDTNLYRSAANELATDDLFKAALGVDVAGVARLSQGANAVLAEYHGNYANTGAIIQMTGTSALVLNRTDTTTVPFKVRGMAAQSGDLQRWENDTPTTLAFLNASGAFFLTAAGSRFGKIASAANVVGYESFVTGDANLRYQVETGGKLWWGDGTASVDTNLYRALADVLKTDDSFAVGSNITTSPAGFIEMGEVTAPAAPGANLARLFVQDNGGGKTQLAVQFPTGAVQVIATEP